MTYLYDAYVEQYGIKKTYDGSTAFDPRGTYITPRGDFDAITHSTIAHGGGFVIPFFRHYMHPSAEDVFLNTKEEYLSYLQNWEYCLRTQSYDVSLKEQKMRLALVRYLINVYQSSKTVWDRKNEIADFAEATGIANNEYNWQGYDVTLKTILVSACNYDAIESNRYRTITTSKFNIYETFYDYILHDYQVFQVPKHIFSQEADTYVTWTQSPFLVSSKELRLKAELDAICRNYPLEQREQFCRSRIKKDPINFIN